ncbi:MAG: DUF2207 domain-containing protein [Bacteroidia bacterium]|nr:DUF2207 domain-containing protein [Bacteroidia bacterium]
MASLQLIPLDPTLPPNPFGQGEEVGFSPYGLDLYRFADKFLYYFEDTQFLIAFLASLIILLTYYTIVYRIGRHEPVQSFGPVFMPPFSLSPGAVRYIALKGFDTKCLVVGLMNAAIKGCYKIRWAPKGFLISQAEEPEFDLLSNDEKSALSYRKDNYWEKVVVSTRTSTKTNKMSVRMKTYLKKRYGKLFRRRLGWVIGGAVFSSLACFGIFSLAQGQEVTFKFFAFFIATWIGLFIPLFFLQLSIQDRYWLGLFTCLLYLGMGITALVMIERFTYGPLFFPVVLPFALINYAFFRVMPTYTPFGQKVMGEILSYKSYLNEKFVHVRQLDGSSGDAVRELPYLLALDMETEHTGYFKDILSRVRYSPFKAFDYIYR